MYILYKYFFLLFVDFIHLYLIFNINFITARTYVFKKVKHFFLKSKVFNTITAYYLLKYIFYPFNNILYLHIIIFF